MKKVEKHIREKLEEDKFISEAEKRKFEHALKVIENKKKRHVYPLSDKQSKG